MPLERDEETALRAAEGGAEKSEYVRRAFSEIAPRYDFLNHLLSFNIDKGWRRKAIRELALDRKPRGRGVSSHFAHGAPPQFAPPPAAALTRGGRARQSGIRQLCLAARRVPVRKP